MAGEGFWPATFGKSGFDAFDILGFEFVFVRDGGVSYAKGGKERRCQQEDSSHKGLHFVRGFARMVAFCNLGSKKIG